MKYYFLILQLIIGVCLFSSCKNNSTNPETKTEAAEEAHNEHENENVVSLSTEQIKTIGIELGSIESKELTNAVKVNGMLTVPNQNKAFVTPAYSGVVKSLNVQPGNFVSKGQTIATITNPDLIQMQQQLQQVNAQIKLAEIEVNRQKQLVEGNAAPLKRLQQAQTELATLRSQRSGLQKQLGSIGASQNYSSLLAVRAPISGTISKVIAQIGSNVDMASPIAEIVSNAQLHLDIYVYEKDLPKVKAGQTIHFTLTNNPGVEYDAQIYSIGSAFEGDSKTIPVHARVTGNKYGLIDGMSVTAMISLDRNIGAAVPNDAIVNNKGQDYIFIVTDRHSEDEHKSENPNEKEDPHNHKEADKPKSTVDEITFERIPIAKGTSDLGYTQITALKEIPQGAKIVTKNAFFVMAKIVNAGEGEHGH